VATAALLVAAAAAPAAAQQPPPQGIPTVPAFVLAVASDPAAAGAAAALQRTGLEVVAATAPFVIDPAAVQAFGAGGGVPDAAMQQEAMDIATAVAGGLESMANLELDVAMAKFAEVIAAFENNPALTLVTGTEPMAQALVGLAVNSFLNGDEGGTRDYLRYSVSVNPTVMPDTDLFPDVAALYTTVVEELGSLSPASITVEVSPQGAEGWIDGVMRGEAPLRTEVQPGRHLFTARANGYTPGGVIVDVPGGRRPQTVRLTLSPAAGGGGSPAAAAAANLPAALTEGTGREMTLLGGIADALAARILLVLWIMPGGETSSMISMQVYDRQQNRIMARALSPEVPLDPASIGPAARQHIGQCIAGPA
jgi:hypothetical protein